jgi:hypothetical protein
LPLAIDDVSSFDVSERGDTLLGVRSEDDRGCVLLLDERGGGTWTQKVGSPPLASRWPLARFYPGGERILVREQDKTRSIAIGARTD